MSDGGRQVEVSLRGRPPDPSRTWDAAVALAHRVLAHHPAIERCHVAVHGDRRSGLRWRLGRDSALSLHWALVPHPDAVLQVLSGDEAAWRDLQRVLPAPPPVRLRPRGRVHDLGPLTDRAQDALLKSHATSPVEAAVTWGRFSATPPRRTLRLGSCSPGEPALVRIHPVLDHEDVPDWFVAFVVFHELLHVVFPPSDGDGRRVLHPRALLVAEANHPDYGRATALERDQVHVWIRRCRERVRP